ncbi:MAG TPA: hypothetical protein VGN96_01545 [Roseococcus sp.]|jgi:hypothetical protein|nr:hypothetical protein [Roseococcus sp.]
MGAQQDWEDRKRAWKDYKRGWKAQRREDRREARTERPGPIFGWRVWLLPLFLWPLAFDIPIEILRGNSSQLVGGILGVALAWMGAARMARGGPGDLRAGAILMGVAAGLTAGLAAKIFPPIAVAMGFGTFFGVRLLTADMAAYEPPPPAPPPPAPTPTPEAASLVGPRAQIARIRAAAPPLPHAPLLLEAVSAMQGVVDDLAARPAQLHEARRFLAVHLDGLVRIVERLEAGAEPPETLPQLLRDLTASAHRLRGELRQVESQALDIQVKVLSDRLRQEGL